MKEFSVPVIFTVDQADDQYHANRIVLNALEHGRRRVAFTDDAVEFLGLDWRIDGDNSALMSVIHEIIDHTSHASLRTPDQTLALVREIAIKARDAKEDR